MNTNYQEAIRTGRAYANDHPGVAPIVQSHINGLCGVLEAVGQERDALAAYAERLREAGAELVDLMDGVREGDYKPDSFTTQPMTMALTESRASLARLKAQWQAEALDEAAMDIRANFGHHTQYSVSLLACAIDGMADAYRRQAEEKKPDDQ